MRTLANPTYSTISSPCLCVHQLDEVYTGPSLNKFELQGTPMTNLMMHLFMLVLLSTFPTLAEAKTVKVFILSGQSNMEGYANIKTFDSIGGDPATEQ